MWSIVCCVILLGVPTLATTNWKENSEYEYGVRGRTLTSLHDVSNQYTGVLFKAILKIQPKSQGEILAQIREAQYSKIHKQLENGWGTRLPESEISWERLQISGKPFKFLMRQGVIDGLVVSKDLEIWEINMIKGIISQFQLKIHERFRLEDDNTYTKEQGVLSTFTVKEDTITGESETLYRINTVPDHLIHTYPKGWQMLNGDKEVNVFEITKYKNYTLNPLMPFYSYGFGGMDGFPARNKIGSFFTRGSSSRVIISGDLNNYTIQNSHSVSEITASPTIGDKQRGSVYSMLNVTLKQISKNVEDIEDILNPIRINNLIYSEQRVGDDELKQHMSSHNISVEQKLQSTFLYSYENAHTKFNEQERIRIGQLVRAYSKEIAEDLQNPYTMLIKATMDKYTILNHLVRLLDEIELKKIGDELYDARQASERDTWKIFRDSITVSGTSPALRVIKEWIETSRIEGVEAAVIVSTMAKSVRELSLEYLLSFFELVKDEKVVSEWPLNDTSVLSFVQLVRQVFIDENYSNAQFSVQNLESIRSQVGNEFLQQVISFCSEELHSAIAATATHKVHVYIRVLGNIAHPQIALAFKPYFEGEKQASQYQRLLMVLAMDKLAEFYPQEARAVLLRLYQNIGEDQSIRSSAVYQIMRTGPSAEVLQYMASYTHRERNQFVAAAVKSAIESAAELKGEQYREIRQAALTAKPLLTTEVFGIQYGGSYLREHLVEELKLHFRETLETVGSEDELYLRGIKYSLQYYLGGQKNELVNFQTLVSSVDELVHVYKQQTEKYSQDQKKQQENHQQHTQNQWSSQYIARMLNLQMKQREQLEGNFYLENGIIQSMFSFVNTTIPTLRRKISDWEQELRSGKQIQYMKLFSQRDMNVAFPTEMGFLFSYSYEVPTVIRVQGSVNASANPRISQKKLNRPQTILISTDLTATMTSKVQGRLSFVTPFDKVKYISGYDKILQVHLPIRGNIEWNLETSQIRAKFQAKDSNDESRIVHYSTWPFTSRVETWKYKPVALSPETKIIKQENVRSYEQVLGKQHTGLAVRIQIEHERQLVDIERMGDLTLKHGLAVGLMSSWNDAEIQFSNLKVSHLKSESSTKEIVLSLGRKVQHRADLQISHSRLSNYVKPEERLEYAINEMSTGIKSAKRESYDLSVEFQGERGKEIKYIVTGAYAKSDVDPNSRILITARKKTVMEAPYVFTFEAKSFVENTSELDLKYIMENEPKMSGEWRITFGKEFRKSGEIRAKWQLKRSKNRKLYLQNLPKFKQCQDEMKSGDYQLPSCQNVTTEFNLFDNIKAIIEYENIPEEMKEMLKTLYYTIRYKYHLNTEVDSKQKSQVPNEISVQGTFDPDLRSMNVSLKTCEEGAIIKSIPVGEISKRLLVLHPVYNVRTRLMALALGSEVYRPSCVVDKTKLSTFLNSVYPGEISNNWTVIFQYMPKHASQRKTSLKDLRYQTKHYVILVQEYMKKKAVKISLSSPETEFKVLDITMLPTKQESSTKLLVDGKEIKVKWNESYEYAQGFVQIYAIPNGELRVEVRDQFYVFFDGKRIKLSLLNSKFRDATRGLCGQYNGNKYEDLLSPSNCLVHDPKKFIDSYEVDGLRGQQVRKELESGNSMVCTRKKTPVYINVVKTSENLKKFENTPENCTKFQTRYIEDGGEICFTLRPMPVCRTRCQPVSKGMKNVPVHCIKDSAVAQIWIKQIIHGGNPDFSHKSESRSLSLELPNNCS